MKPVLRTTQDLLDQGYSHNTIGSNLRNRTLTALRRGIYVDTEDWTALYPSDKHLLKIQALALQGNYAFTHASAALLLGFPLLNVPSEVQIYAGTTSRAKVQGANKHFYRIPPETMQHHGKKVTTPKQTLIDCTKTLTLNEALCIADSILHQQALTPDAAHRALTTATGRGSRQCRRVAELMSPLSESPGETLTRLELIKAGIPFTEQFPIETEGVRYRADFAIDGYMIILEFDGDIKYRNDPTHAVLAERKRERALQNLGWTVIRVEWRHLQEPGRVAQMVRDAMRRA